jgi:hypothetical protein
MYHIITTYPGEKMTQAETCTQCGKKVYVYARTTAICDECIQRIFAELGDLDDILKKPSPEEEEDEVIYGSPEVETNFSDEYLIGDELDRACLKCSRKFIAIGKYTRICDACKESTPYKDEPVTIYQ